MLRYILIRILLFFPTLFIISAFAFFLYRSSPGDPVENLLDLKGISKSGEVIAYNYDREYISLSDEMGFNKKPFYLSIYPHYYPDTLHSIRYPAKKKRALDLLRQHKSWPDVQYFLSAESRLYEYFLSLPDSSDHKAGERYRMVDLNMNETDFDIILERINGMEIHRESDGSEKFSALLQRYLESAGNIGEQKLKLFPWPSIHWHGLDNQFHFWFVKMLRGDFGYSLVDGKKVQKKLFDALIWTITIIFPAILLSFLIAIPIGVISAKYHGSLYERGLGFVLYLIYGIPVFWLATLMVIFFTSNEYGNWTNIFPSVALNMIVDGDSEWSKIAGNISKLILPIICLAIHSLAYLSRQTRSGMLDEMKKPYSLALRARGLSADRVLWRHNFPNTLIALSTLFFGSIPAALVGSLVIEVIFNIPGMGRLMYQSIFLDDWPILFTALTIFGVATMISYLLGDISYGFLNPKIRYRKS